MSEFLIAASATAGVWVFIAVLTVIAMALAWACERGGERDE